MKTAILIAILSILCFTSCNEKKENPIDYPIMGQLKTGKYTVGFKTLFLYDKTRNGIPYSGWDGKLLKNHDPEKGRQHQINIWYPAEAASGTNIKYEHYVNLIGRHTNFEDTEVSREFAKKLFISQTNDLGGNGNFTSKELNKLIKLNVLARLDAKALSGTYPVVVFPNGSSPAYQSIMAEYLSSYGYVVVAFAAKGRYSSGLEVSTIGLETAVDDLEFVLNKISELSFTDMNSVALLANAISSSVCAAAVSRNDKLKALISLEGGLPSNFEQRLLNKSVFYQPENITTPMLFIYALHPSIDPKYTFHLKFAKRHYARFPEMSEFVMLNYGMFDSFVPEVVGKQKGDTQKGYEAANQLVLGFLDVYLKKKDKNIFENKLSAISKNIIDTTFILDALPAVPPISELKNSFMERGFETLDSAYHKHKERGNAQPFSDSFYTSFRYWLAWKKDPEYQFRNRLYALAYDSYPESSKINYYRAYYLQKTNDNKQAKYHYKKAISLLKKGVDSSLNKKEKDQIIQNSEKALLEI